MRHTSIEILQQPEMWRQTYDCVAALADAYRKFLSDRKLDKHSEVILCGAGSSEFVAQTVADIFCMDGYTNVRSIPTTDLVVNPAFYVHREDTVLAFTFARSGDSPESRAAYVVLNNYCKNVYHVMVTCNKKGALLSYFNPDKDFKVILPDSSNDVSLVMTSSFSSMCMAAILLSEPDRIYRGRPLIEEAAIFAESFFDQKALRKEKEIAVRPITRVVVLGNGPLKGIARECHLKMQEMTNGEVVASFDSFMGFRHGPKAIVNDNTILVYLMSDSEGMRKYELDLMRQVGRDHHPLAQIVVSKQPLEDPAIKPDLQINAPAISSFENNPFTAIVPVILGQTLGFYMTLARNMNPDNPSVNGAISRVVTGVNIY